MQIEVGATSCLGANAVVNALVDAGVDTFFMNPGTSEVHLVAAIDSNELAKPVLCLFEGAATGAADGYARACGRPAAVLLHLGPGLANGLANLHNARKANSPMVVIVGEHSAEHLEFDTPLRSDVAALAGFAAGKVFSLAPGDDIVKTIQAAVAAAMRAPEGPVIVIANVDAMWACISVDHRDAFTGAPAKSSEPVQAGLLEQAAQSLGIAGSGAALIVGGDALTAEAIALAGSVATATGCKLMMETFNAQQARGAGVVAIERLPYFRELAQQKLAPFSLLVLVGSRPPVAFFASPGERSELHAPGSTLIRFDRATASIDILRQLAAMLQADKGRDAGAGSMDVPLRVLSEMYSGRLNARSIWASVNVLLPAGAIVSDESGVTSIGSDEAMRTALPHQWFNLTGGSIGQALPVATGAALARPEARVLAMQGDGGAMYTIQALWTQVRERANVVNVILRNDRYAILEHEVKRHGIAPLGPKGAAMFDLTNPSIDWVAMASSMGMCAQSASTAEEFHEALREGLEREGPCLIEARILPPLKRTAVSEVVV